MTRFRASVGFAVVVLCAVPLLVYSTPPQAVPAAAVAVTSGDLNLTFTTIDVPGAGYTGVWGINTAGEMVGNYGQNTSTDSHGFLYSNGAFTYFDYPGETITLPAGINDVGLIVGYAGNGPVTGFLYDGATFTSIRHGPDSATVVFGINNGGDIVGGAGTVYTTRAFRLRDGQYTPLRVPGSYTYAYGTGINNLHQIVGWTDSDGFTCHVGKCWSVDFPGATTTHALAINDDGVIVGWYDMAPYSYAFALRNGRFLSFGYPGAIFTGAAGINSSGQVVGEYTFDFQSWHGFVTNPITQVDFESPHIQQNANSRR